MIVRRRQRSALPGKKAQKVFAAATSGKKIVIESISFWKLEQKTRKEKLILPLSTRALPDIRRQTGVVSILPTRTKTRLESATLDWPHHDPVDRIIAAAARRQEALLLTSDQR